MFQASDIIEDCDECILLSPTTFISVKRWPSEKFKENFESYLKIP